MAYRLALCLTGVLVLGGVSCTPPHRMVYSAGFSFSKYDYLVVAKPATGTNTSMYGMDIEIANLLARYNMKIVGDKEFPALSDADKKRTLFTRFAVVSNSKKDNLITVSFDDAVSGITVASLTSRAKGDMFDVSDRNKAMESISTPLIDAIAREKGMSVTDSKAKSSK